MNKYAYISFGLALTLSSMVHASDPVRLANTKVIKPILAETVQRTETSVVSPKSLPGDHFQKEKAFPGDNFRGKTLPGDHFTSERSLPGDQFTPKQR